MKRRRVLVVSGVNLVEGGTLKVFREFVKAAEEELDSSWKIVALVHSRETVKTRRAKAVSIAWPKKSWLNRLFFEWIVSERIARRLRPDLWVALHDITPRVGDVRKVVYCHNAMPFYRPSIKEARYDKKIWLFSYLYGFLYGLGIRGNSAVVVQQDWMRNAFRDRYGINNIVVAYPTESDAVNLSNVRRADAGGYQFIFPSLARPFKNFEVVCAAAEILENRGFSGFRVVLTIDPFENAYAEDLWTRFGRVKSVAFVGRQTFEEIQKLYATSDCLVFPSRIETWGLPISEAKACGLALLVADEPYAYETVGSYNKARFFDASKPEELAEIMGALINGVVATNAVTKQRPHPPFVDGWRDLVKLICNY